MEYRRVMDRWTDGHLATATVRAVKKDRKYQFGKVLLADFLAFKWQKRQIMQNPLNYVPLAQLCAKLCTDIIAKFHYPYTTHTNTHFIFIRRLNLCRSCTKENADTHLDYVYSAAAWYSAVGRTNVRFAHRSVCTCRNALPADPVPEYYRKPQKTQMCQHLPQQPHKQA